MTTWFRVRRFRDGSSMWKVYSGALGKWTFKRAVMQPEDRFGWSTERIANAVYFFGIAKHPPKSQQSSFLGDLFKKGGGI